MRHAVPTIAALAVFAAFSPALAQTQSEILEHIDDLGRRNEKLQEKVITLENENKALREQLRQLGAEAPSPAPIAPPPPTPASPRVGAPSPAPVAPQPAPTPASPTAAEPGPTPIAPQPGPMPAGPGAVQPSPPAAPAPARAMPSPAGGAVWASFYGTIDLNSDPRGAIASTSLGSGCKTPCAMEISTDRPFTVTFTHPGYAPVTVEIGVQPGQPGVSNPKFAPNPVFVQLAPQSKKKPAASGPQKLGPTPDR